MTLRSPLHGSIGCARADMQGSYSFCFAYAPSRALLAGGRISGSEVSGGSPGPNRGPTGGTCAFFCFFVVEATSRLSLRPESTLRDTRQRTATTHASTAGAFVAQHEVAAFNARRPRAGDESTTITPPR